jgi:hypothetical protein
VRVATAVVRALDPGFVLSPERYASRDHSEAALSGTPLTDVAVLSKRTVSPSKEGSKGHYWIADTGDASEGVLTLRRTKAAGLGSTKKVLGVGDVLISRLRPYLRQVAYIDDELPGATVAQLVCSTEFYVLSPVDERSIAFLVPWLLSERVQDLFASSQEGGHHPRFNVETLTRLRIPERVLTRREDASRNVEEAIRLLRRSERLVDSEITFAQSE